MTQNTGQRQHMKKAGNPDKGLPACCCQRPDYSFFSSASSSSLVGIVPWGYTLA